MSIRVKITLTLGNEKQVGRNKDRLKGDCGGSAVDWVKAPVLWGRYCKLGESSRVGGKVL